MNFFLHVCICIYLITFRLNIYSPFDVNITHTKEYFVDRAYKYNISNCVNKKKNYSISNAVNNKNNQ